MVKTIIQPISNEPALFIPNKKILVVADLHIGIENELKEQGLNVPSQTDDMINHLISLCKKYKPKEIILLGDIKHNIPTSTIQERRDVKFFLEEIKNYAKISIIPGNHDGNIQRLTQNEITIHPSDGITIGDIGFIHGHRWPNKEVMNCKQIVMGHTHPTVMLKDRLGYKSYEPCWIKAKFSEVKLKEKFPDSKDPELLIMPAFNPLCGGIAANKDGIAGPIRKIMDIENSQVYLLDGTDMGRLEWI